MWHVTGCRCSGSNRRKVENIKLLHIKMKKIRVVNTPRGRRFSAAAQNAAGEVKLVEGSFQTAGMV